MGALLANGLFEGIERSTRMRDLVEPEWFAAPWWYRSTFFVEGSARTTIRLDGVVHRGDVFVNGKQVTAATQLVGAYSNAWLDVTSHVRPGLNALAVRVHPGHPYRDFSISWVDWNQWPPDNNMGVWRDVVVERTGDVRLAVPHVKSALPDGAEGRAELEVSVEVTNLGSQAVDVELTGKVSGPFPHRDGGGATPALEIELRRSVRCEAGETMTVEWSPATDPALAVESPALWWPAMEGEHPLHELELTARVDGELSDRRRASFGIRTVTSRLEPGGGRRFAVNGRDVQIIGGGWAPDLFLRHDEERIRTELGLALDLGFNTIRLEGKLENPEFYDICDELGVMVLAGWECCSKWEGDNNPEGADWAGDDWLVAECAMRSEALRLRNHPSVIAFLIGSDFAPPARAASLYVEALERARWSVPIVSSATAEGTEAAGPSGMKMTGSYDWVPPVYWYSTDPSRGGAVGFNSEAGTGNNIPRLPSLEQMLSPDELETLWREPAAKQYHAGPPPSPFDNLAIFNEALASRYGPPTSLGDYLRKARLANYEAARAQFEAYVSRFYAEEPATGLIYWMFNSAWPSLNWQLHDWYLDTGAAYYGTKKALEPLHALYDYAERAAVLVNRTHRQVGPASVQAEIRRLDGELLATIESPPIRLGPRLSAPALDLAGRLPAEGSFFVSLRSVCGDEVSASNVYWLAAEEDTLEWEATSWQYTPAASFADLTALGGLPPSRVAASCVSTAARLGVSSAELKVTNTSPDGVPVVAMHASVTARDDGRAPVPAARWSDNEITLFGGESTTLTVHYASGGLPTEIEIDGFNLDQVRFGLD